MFGLRRSQDDPIWPGWRKSGWQCSSVLNVEEGGERSIPNGDAQSEDYLHETARPPGRTRLERRTVQYGNGRGGAFWSLFRSAVCL